ncbi:mitochondrial 37S ribosomal protein bS21m [Lodderomyces beijingensis]|uniref:Uncharacterized protein n=1 Tax=Lodderomyces beijingensis TaxID=1775926 RepID=A0ABP0ZFA2_9ASCO
MISRLLASYKGGAGIKAVPQLRVFGSAVSYAPVRFNSLFSPSPDPKNLGSKQEKKSKIDIDELLKSSIPELSFKDTMDNHFGLESNRQPTPREVAKGIREFGPNAGRIVEVYHQNVAKSFSANSRLNSTNKIRYLQKIQSRYIRPAKYRKQLRREWWRRHFSAGFKDMMAQVNDARRRGY